MRIAIITLPLHTNYGGILQAYALQKTLRNMGCQVEFIEKVKCTNLLPLKLRYFIYIKRLIRKIFIGSKERVFLESYRQRTDDVVRQNTNAFIKKYISIRYIKDESELSESDYDAIVVGSDQIWRRSDRNQHKDYFPFLDFAKNWGVKKVAYACSFGSDNWRYTPEETAHITTLVKSFDYISVREKSAIELCEHYLGVKAENVLDPTLLLNKEDYIALVKDSEALPSKGNLMCYVLDESKQVSDLIKMIARDYNLIPFRANSRVEDIMAPLKERIQPPVEQWIQGFIDAEFVITDSFHACVFSMIFNKPFICVGNKERGMTRFYSLFEMFNQEFRLCDCDNVDWPLVAKPPFINCGNEKDLSLNYLQIALFS